MKVSFAFSLKIIILKNNEETTGKMVAALRRLAFKMVFPDGSCLKG